MSKMHFIFYYFYCRHWTCVNRAPVFECDGRCFNTDPDKGLLLLLGLFVDTVFLGASLLHPTRAHAPSSPTEQFDGLGKCRTFISALFLRATNTQTKTKGFYFNLWETGYIPSTNVFIKSKHSRSGIYLIQTDILPPQPLQPLVGEFLQFSGWVH